MARNLSTIQREIARLQQQAETLKKNELADVIARIREAIEEYSLTPDELFGKAKANGAKANGANGRTRSAKRAAKPSRGAVKRKRLPAKYRDDQGNAWTGRGSQPRWLVAALKSGKKISDFMV